MTNQNQVQTFFIDGINGELTCFTINCSILNGYSPVTTGNFSTYFDAAFGTSFSSAFSNAFSSAFDSAVSGRTFPPSSHSHSEYAASNHNHDAVYSFINHSHNQYVTIGAFEALESRVAALEG